jgi:nucleoside-diphosphate-sugar epimerase
MKVLVTGAGSLLMAGVAARLAARGDEVVCLQRRPLSLPADGRIWQVQGDVRDEAAVARAAEGCEAVVHGAARVGVVG